MPHLFASICAVMLVFIGETLAHAEPLTATPLTAETVWRAIRDATPPAG